MKYIVLDLEWNRPSSICRKGPAIMKGEIIQIGAVMLDENFNEIDEFNVFVKPTFFKVLNKEIEILTGITHKDLADGIPFPEAINAFMDWCGNDSILLTWGGEDCRMLNINLKAHELTDIVIPESFDAQIMFDELEMYGDREYSLDYAVYYFGIKGNKGHNALNDARDTASVIRNLDYIQWIQEERLYRESLESECIAS